MTLLHSRSAAPPMRRPLPGVRVARRLWAGLWWALRLHVAERHHLPRGELGEPPPGAPDWHNVRQ